MTDTSHAVIYARQSLDRHGDTLAVSRQLDLCRRFCDQRGWTVTAEYVDNDTSATSGRDRPEFEALLASKPPRIVTWHLDRLVRLTRDLERVIALGVDVHTVEAGTLDLSNPAGRATARTVTAWATYEVEQKAIRQRAANDQRAAAGQPYRGQRAFGYEPDGLTIRESEARELRAAAEGVLRGQTLQSIARGMNARGVRTATGRTWKGATLRAALLSPRNAGLRRHRGEVVGPAAWPAILDEDTAVAVRSILSDPSRYRGPGRRYLLSGVMVCEVCGKPVHGAFIKDDNKGETYRCLGHVSRKVAPVDAAVTAVAVARLSQPDAVDLFTRDDQKQRSRELQAERADLRARLDHLAEAFAAGDIDRQQLTRGTARLRARVDQIEAEIAAASAAPSLSEIVTADDVSAAFTALPMEAQRQVIDHLMTITLRRVGPGRRTFNPAESLRIEWRHDG